MSNLTPSFLDLCTEIKKVFQQLQQEEQEKIDQIARSLTKKCHCCNQVLLYLKPIY